MQAQTLNTVYSYNGMRLKAPSSSMDAVQVKDFYSAMYPELTTAELFGPTVEGQELVYEFRPSVGTKA